MVIVPPRSLKYLGSSISDPDVEEVSLSRTFLVEETEAPEDEGSDDEDDDDEDDDEEDDE